MPFKSLRLNEPILRALADEGYEKPTPIQAKAIPPILEGRDVLGCAQTGTGKTAAFALPIIHRLHEMPVDKARKGPVLPRALILSPTRELASQIAESFETYGKHVGLSHAVIFGGVSQFHQVRALHRGVDVLVATPGRLMDLMEQGHVNLTKVCVFVLDEADRMLDMGFIQPIRRISSALPKPRQTLLFSATMPREIMHLADSLLNNPVKVAVAVPATTVPLIEQQLYMVQGKQKPALLERLLEGAGVDRAIVFTKTKHGADKVCRRLERAGVASVAIHGNKAQNYRTRALDAFREGRCRVLVATDVAARGLDVDNITHVFNFDLPMEPEGYIHRIGRTGRAGAKGVSISFCDPAERDLLRSVQRLIGKQIPVMQLPTDLPNTPAYGESESRGGHQGSYQSSSQGAYQGASHGGSRGPSRGAPREGRGSGRDHPDNDRRPLQPRPPSHESPRPAVNPGAYPASRGTRAATPALVEMPARERPPSHAGGPDRPAQRPHQPPGTKSHDKPYSKPHQPREGAKQRAPEHGAGHTKVSARGPGSAHAPGKGAPRKSARGGR